jgi:hypothetical protein
MSDLDFINLLNETSVTYISDLSDYWWEDESGAPRTGPGFEAISRTGEIRAFDTYLQANDWRLAELRGDGLSQPYQGQPTFETCPIHGAGCEAWS